MTKTEATASFTMATAAAIVTVLSVLDNIFVLQRMSLKAFFLLLTGFCKSLVKHCGTLQHTVGGDVCQVLRLAPYRKRRAVTHWPNW